jgi:hypothetical protein
MNRHFTTTMGLAWPAVVIADLYLFAVIIVVHSVGQMPGALRGRSEQFDVRVLPQAAITWQTGYETTAPAMEVWRWYSDRFGIAPAAGIDAAGNCLTLTKAATDGRHPIRVLICSAASGTRVSMSQRLYFFP